MLLTDSAIVHRSGAEWRRLALGDADFMLNFNKQPGGSDMVETLIVTVPDAPPDTIYTALGGIEFSRLRTSLATVMAARSDSDSASDR